jgi:asparagine synthase (glutamine-hydrolysing)
MCGIAGWIGSDQSLGETELKRMIAAERHRGPDGAGYRLIEAADGRRVALGHCRLSIIDLAGGAQPMATPDGAQIVTFNGEIYNYRELARELSAIGHRFSTQSDTEVVLEAYRRWGPACLERLRGMFAFALWDGSSQSLFLARDRFGKKPLFLMERGGTLAFASEIGALLALPGVERRFSSAALGLYLDYRYVPGPETLFDGIRKLPPGHAAVWRSGRLEIRRWYEPPDAREREPRRDVPDVVGEFLEELDEAVRVRMVSDVPFGAFLSGGIDSSSIVALMSRHSPFPVKTFSVGFTDAAYSELAYAAEVARHFRTDHREIVIGPEAVRDDLARLTRFRGAPIGEPADIPIYRMSLEAARTVKMVLTGEGSDEMLGGYPKHVFERFVARYQTFVPETVHRHVIGKAAALLPYKYYRLQTLAATAGCRDWNERMARWFGAMAHDDRVALASLPPVKAEIGDGVDSGSALRAILAFDQQSWLPDNLLERGDRMTMAASIEARMPFMDHELAAFVSSLPDRYRVRGTTTKWILRQAMARILPSRILTRPKVGFRVPVNDWFRTTWRDFLTATLGERGAISREIVPAPFIERILAEHIGGRRNHEKLLWTLLTLEVFQQQYGLSTARLGLAA